MTPALLLALALPAAAQDRAVVVYGEGAPQAAVQAVRSELGDDAQGVVLDAQRLGDLVTGPPQIIGGGQGERCKGPGGQENDAQPVPLARFVERVEEIGLLLRALEFERALMAARSAEKLLPCLSELAPAETVRDFYLQWATAAARLHGSYAAISPQKAAPYYDEVSRAYESWRRFIHDERDLVRRADAIGTPDGRAIARSVLDRRTLSTTLSVVPVVDGLWIDGSAVKPGETQRLLTGRHLVQYRAASGAPIQSLWVQLQANAPATLAIPELIPDNATDWVADRALRDDLAALLGVLEGAPVYVVTSQDRIWRGVAGDPDEWEELSPTVVPGLRLARVGRVVTWSGVGLAGLSALAMGTACVANRPTEPDDLEWYQCGTEEIDPAYAAFAAIQVPLFVGIGTAGAGLGINLAGRARMTTAVVTSPSGVTPVLGLSVHIGGVRARLSR